MVRQEALDYIAERIYADAKAHRLIPTIEYKPTVTPRGPPPCQIPGCDRDAIPEHYTRCEVHAGIC